VVDKYVAISNDHDRTGEFVPGSGDTITYDAGFLTFTAAQADATWGSTRPLANNGENIFYEVFDDGIYTVESAVIKGSFHLHDGVSNFATIRAAVGHEHGGNVLSGAMLDFRTGLGLYTIAIRITGYTRITGLRIRSQAGCVTLSSIVGAPILERLIVKSDNNHGISPGSIGRIYGCLAYECGSFGFDAGPYAQVTYRNCVAINNGGLGFTIHANVNAGSSLSNCVAINNTGGDWSPVATPTFLNCASGDLSAPAGGTSISDLDTTHPLLVFEDITANNIHLKAGSPLEDAGVDASSSLTLDIDAQPWELPYSIGVDQPGEFTVTITIDGVPVGSEIRAFAVTDDAIVGGIETTLADPASFDVPFTAVLTARFVFIQPNFEYAKVNALINGDGATFPVSISSDRDYTVTAGMSVSDVSFATGTSLLTVDTVQELQDIYSYTIEQWKADAALPVFEFPFDAVSAEAGIYEFIEGWDFADDATRHNTRGAGWALVDTNAVKLEQWLNAKTLGSAAGQPYYLLGVDTVPVSTQRTDVQDTVIKIYGDGTHGNFDKRDGFKMFLREQGKTYSQYDLFADQGVTELTNKTYFIPLANSTDPKISASDATIAVAAIYTGMSVEYLVGSGFDAWINSTVYAADSVVSDGGRWYITALGGTSSGTGVGDDVGVTDWVAYSGERSIDSVYYAFNVVFTGNSGTTQQIYEKSQYLLRQSTDIDSGAGTTRGDTADLLMSFLGDILITAQGVAIDGFQVVQQLDYRFTDVGGVERQFPAPTETFTISPGINSDIRYFDGAGDDQTPNDSVTGLTLDYDYSTSDPIDIEVLKEGYVPVNIQDSVPFFGTLNIEMDFDEAYNASHSLAVTTHYTYNIVTKALNILADQNALDVRSSMADLIRLNSGYFNTPLLMDAIPGLVRIDQTDGMTVLDMQYWKGAGSEVFHVLDSLNPIEKWYSIQSVGNIAGATTHYRNTNSGNSTAITLTNDVVDETFQYYADANHDGTPDSNTDDYLLIKSFLAGSKQARLDVLVNAGVSALKSTLYTIPLSNADHGYTGIDPSITGMTLVAGGVVGGKTFAYKWVDANNNSGADIANWINMQGVADPNGVISGGTGLTWFEMPDMVIYNGATIETGNGLKEGATPVAVGFYVERSGADHPDFTRFESDTPGDYYDKPVTANASITGLPVAGNAIWLQIKNETKGTTPFDGDPGGTGFSDSYTEGTTYAAGDIIRIRFAELATDQTFKMWTGSAIATSTGWAAIYAGNEQLQYGINGVDGSSAPVTNKFSGDFINDEIDFIIAGAWTSDEAYAFYCYMLTTSDGIENFWEGITALEGAYRIEVPILALWFNNNVATSFHRTDSKRIYRSDGAYPVREPTTSGYGVGIGNWLGSVSVVEVNTGTAVNKATVKDAMTEQGYTVARSPLIDGITDILADSNELQLNQGNWLTATGFNTVVPDNTSIGLILTESQANTPKIDTIVTKTSGLTYTVPGEVDANIKSAVDTPLSGTPQ